jgi:hypothetical protein
VFLFKLFGMGQVVASAYAQYFIFAYTLFAIFCVASSKFIYITIINNLPLNLIFESVMVVTIGYLVVRICDRFLYVAGEMANPVLWTWYSTYFLTFNLVKGALDGIRRIINMAFWIVIQIGIIDQSNFPEGKEGWDPVFVSFFQTLNFHHRCASIRQLWPCKPTESSETMILITEKFKSSLAASASKERGRGALSYNFFY